MKTINYILEKLKVNNDSTIEDLKNHFNCEYYDILTSLLEHGLIQFSEDGFSKSEYGEKYIKYGNDIKSYVWDIKICNFLLYDILLSKRKRYDLNDLYTQIYLGNDIIHQINIDDEINIITKTGYKKMLLSEIKPLKEIYLTDQEYIPPSYMRDALNNRENYQKYLAYRNDGEIIKTINIKPSITVRYYTNGHIYCIDDELQRITFYMLITKNNNKVLGSYIEIQGLYREKSVDYTKTIPEDMYLNYLINNHQTVVSDIIQTNDGSNFWKKIVKNALSKHLKIYVFGMGDDYDNIPYDTNDLIQLETLQEFDEFTNHRMIWHDSNTDYAKVRLIISSRNYFK